MIQTFLINLDRDQERLLSMEEQLHSLDISFSRFSAIYGKEINAYDYIDAEKSLRVEGRKLSPGDIGTALSHRSVYEQIIQNNFDYALILEDDVLLPKNFKEIVIREVQRNQEVGGTSWEYLAFDYGPMDLSLFGIWFRSYPVLLSRATPVGKAKILAYGFLKFFFIIPIFLFEIIRNYFRRSYSGAVRFYRPMYNAGAYIVTMSGADKLVKLATPVYCTSDRLHNQARVKSNLKVRWFAPAIVRQARERFGSTSSDQKAQDYQDGKAYVK